MCGIAGCFCFGKKKEVDRLLIERMINVMTHRGPDAGGTWIADDGSVGLGHRRLSIIDLSEAASQPMSDDSGEIWVVYNGEIYNFAELRDELKDMHHFRTRSDTEVILYAYREWGIECIHRFRGMFAFALWDARKRELYLVRDRIGIKPLYYTLSSSSILFASEIKALLQHPRVERAVDIEAFYHYMSFLTSPAPKTLFKGIYKLPPATWLKVDERGNVQEHRYWDPIENAESISGSEEDISAELLARLEEAVRYRMVSDVPVGVFLSGGIDSSTNAVLFSKHSRGEPVCTFSIGYRGDYKTYANEFEYARRVAQMIGARHHEIVIGEDDLISFLSSLVYHQDEPIGDPVCVPVYYVSKLARDNGVIVCQVGEGSDELFWGYPGWKILLQLQRWGNLPVPRLFKRVLLSAIRMLGKGSSGYYEFLRRNTEGQPVFWGGAEAFYEAEKRNLLSTDVKDELGEISSFDAIEPFYRRFCRTRSVKKDPLLWMTYLDLNFRLPELLLMRVDKMSMAVSLEARVPFLDHRFVEYVMGIPEDLKTKNDELKYILKKAVENILPHEIVYRKKQGFGVPVYEWFESRLGEVGRRKLLEFASRTEFFDRQYLQEFLETTKGVKLWYLLNFVLWYEMWIEGKEAIL